jgi:dolichol-phosphate mannosyltransferase
MRCVVIVPTYNESSNVPELAACLLALEPSVDVLIVDDASPDGTGELADRIAASDTRFSVLHRTGPRGYAAACREGIAHALEIGYDRICTMDADLSHDPTVLPALIAATENADLAIGSRYTPGGSLEVRWGPVRLAVSKAGSVYAGFMLGSPIRDCTSGFRCYRTAALQRFDIAGLESEGYCFLIEMLAALSDAGCSAVEVPIRYVERIHGTSKISRRIIVEALLRTTVMGVRRITGRPMTRTGAFHSADSA